jgi:hypothetical protein
MANLLSDEEELRRFNAAQSDQPWYARALPMEGRATILPFRDTMPGSVFNKRELALPGLLAEAVNAFTSPARSLLGTDPEFNPQKEAANMALNMFGGGIATGKALTNPTGVGGTDLALNVWHGTPHEIKGKFDISKVGTGEGAQAYGHGMYFGGARETGEKYALDLANRDISNQNRLNPHANAQRLVKLAGDPKYAADDIKFVLETSPDHAQKELLSATLKMIETGDYAKPLQTTGNLYKADIPDAAIPMMLDWDKPVSKELLARITPENLGLKVKQFDDGLGYVTDAGVLVTRVKQGKAKEVTEEMLKNSFNDSLNRYSNSGQNLYGWLVPGNAPAASQILSNAGITGIKYLDEGSRAAGKGTSNYVVFDPSTVKILEKNDIKIEDLIEKGLLGD